MYERFSIRDSGGVHTTDRVVTLKGAVTSAAARDRAVVIAAGTEGVTRVVNHLVVKK